MSTLPSLSKLTPEQVNRMCAEARGFHRVLACNGACYPDGTWVNRALPYEEALSLICPDYATDPAAALTLCESLESDGWGICIEMETHSKEWEALFTHDAFDAQFHISTSLSLAICGAFLKAKNLATE